MWNCGGLTGAAYRFGLEEDCLESFARRAREGHRNRKSGTRNRAADRLDWSRACSYVGVRTGTRNTSADSRCMWLSRSRNPLGVARYCSIRLQPASSCDSEEWIQGRNFTFVEMKWKFQILPKADRIWTVAWAKTPLSPSSQREISI